MRFQRTFVPVGTREVRAVAAPGSSPQTSGRAGARKHQAQRLEPSRECWRLHSVPGGWSGWDDRGCPDEFRERAVRLAHEWRKERDVAEGVLQAVVDQLGISRETTRPSSRCVLPAHRRLACRQHAAHRPRPRRLEMAIWSRGDQSLDQLVHHSAVALGRCSHRPAIGQGALGQREQSMPTGPHAAATSASRTSARNRCSRAA